MKNSRILIMILCALVLGVSSCTKKKAEAPMEEPIAAKSSRDKPYKPKFSEFQPSLVAKILEGTPLKVEVCFQMNSPEVDVIEEDKKGKKIKKHLIPPDPSNVRLELTKAGQENPNPPVYSSCRLRAYKLNPKDKAKKKEKGDLIKAKKGEAYCTSILLSEAFKGYNFTRNPAGTDRDYNLKAYYSWQIPDSELDDKDECPEEVGLTTGDPAECYPILLGDISTEPPYISLGIN